MRTGTKNAMRSGLVVIGSLAFGYLSLQLGFKPYLENARMHSAILNQSPEAPVDHHHHSDTHTSTILQDDEFVSDS